MIKLVSLKIRKLNIQEVFLSLANHCTDQDPLDGHIIQLIRLILKNYFTVKHHLNTTINFCKNEVPNRIRQKLTKTVIFCHQ